MRASRRALELLLLIILVLAPCSGEAKKKKGVAKQPVSAPLPAAVKPLAVIDKTGKIVIAPNYDMIDAFSDGMALVKKGDLCGFINAKGVEVVRPQYAYALPFSEGFAAFEVDHAWGFIDKTGKQVIKPFFDHAGRFSEGLAAVERGYDYSYPPPAPVTSGPWEKIGSPWGFFLPVIYELPDPRWGYINTKLELVIGFQFAEAREFSEGMALVHVVHFDRGGFIDKKGNFVIPMQEPIYSKDLEYEGSCREGMIQVRNHDYKRGFKDAKGDVVIPVKLDNVDEFHEGLAAVSKKGKWGFMDKTGTMVIKQKYSQVGYFSGGLTRFRKGDKWGFMDKTGQAVIEPTFDWAEDFSEGLAPVKTGDRWGYIDAKGAFAIPPQFYYAEAFSEGLAVVRPY